MKNDYLELLTRNIILETSIESFQNGNRFEFFEKLLLRLKRYFEFDGWSIVDMSNRDPKFLFYSKNYETLNLRELEEKMSDREKLLYMKVIKSKKWRFEKDLQKKSIWIPRGNLVYSWIGIPLIFKNSEILVLNLDFFIKKNLSKKEKVFLNEFQENFLKYTFKISKLRDIFNQQYVDALTGLKNRQYLFDILNKVDTSQKLGIIFCDLDKFKDINDKYGHTFGDEVLKIISKRMRNLVKSTDEVVRFGGDEFIVLTRNSNGLFKIIERLKKFIDEREIILDDKKIKIGISCGYAIFPDESEDFAEILHISDMRMYRDKESKREKNE